MMEAKSGRRAAEALRSAKRASIAYPPVQVSQVLRGLMMRRQPSPKAAASATRLSPLLRSAEVMEHGSGISPQQHVDRVKRPAASTRRLSLLKERVRRKLIDYKNPKETISIRCLRDSENKLSPDSAGSRAPPRAQQHSTSIPAESEDAAFHLENGANHPAIREG
jgi:hypothetical protein